MECCVLLRDVMLMRYEVVVRLHIKNTFGILTIALAASAATAGEIEQFISETMAERRAQNAREAVKTETKSEIQQIVLPESKLSAKTKLLKSRSYRYDKAGRLVCPACGNCVIAYILYKLLHRTVKPSIKSAFDCKLQYVWIDKMRQGIRQQIILT